MFNRHLSITLRFNRKVNVTGNVTDMNISPKHIVTIWQQGQNMIRPHMATRTKTAVATVSRIIENHWQRMNAQTVWNRLKAVGLRAKRQYVGTCITISDRNRRRRQKGCFWLDATSGPQGLGRPNWSKDSASYRDKDT